MAQAHSLAGLNKWSALVRQFLALSGALALLPLFPPRASSRPEAEAACKELLDVVLAELRGVRAA